MIAFAVQDCLSFTVIGQGTLFVTFAALLSQRSQPCVGNVDEPEGNRREVAVALLTAAVLFTLLLWRNIDAESARAVPGWGWGMLTILGSLGVACAAVLRLLGPSAEPGRKRSETPAAWGFSAAPVGGPGPARAVLGGAAVALVQALVLGPLQVDLECRRGDQIMFTDVAAAMHVYEEAAARAANDPFYWAKLGSAAREALGRESDRAFRMHLAEMGRSAYACAAELMPANASYHVGLGRMNMELARLGRAAPRQALAEYDAALGLDGNNGVYYADAANAALVMEQLDAAHTYAREGLERYPWYGPLRAQSGYVAMLEHHPDEAVRQLTLALEGEWFEDVAAKKFAESVLARARQQAGK